MQKLDIPNIPLQDRRKLFIVEEDIDRLVWKISGPAEKKNRMLDCQLVTVGEYKQFFGDTYQIGDILLWSEVKKSYIKWDDYLTNNEATILDKFRHFLMVDLQAKSVKLNVTQSQEKSEWLNFSLGADGHMKKITAEAKADFDKIKKSLTKIAKRIEFNEGEKAADDVDCDAVETTLKETGLINIQHFVEALDTCRRGGSANVEYDFFQETEDLMQLSANIGFDLAGFLGINAFLKWNSFSNIKITASCSFHVEF